MAGFPYISHMQESSTLKPYIDAHYRTRPERDYTGIMGSSLGGLTSMYAAIEHQDVFSKAGVFSPSFWFSSQAYTHVTQTGKQADMRIYMIAGQNESATMASDLNNMYNTLLGAGFRQDEIKKVIHPDGAHTEWYWAREFPAAYQWLYRENTTGQEEKNWEKPLLKAFPNPSDTNFHLITTAPLVHAEYEVLSMDGRIVQQRKPLNGKGASLENLKAGLYFLRAYSDGELAGVVKLVRQ